MNATDLFLMLFIALLHCDLKDEIKKLKRPNVSRPIITKRD